MDRKDILAEIEDVIRSMPARATIRHETTENHQWLGRAAGALNYWNPAMSGVVKIHIDEIFDVMAKPAARGLRNLIVLLERARSELRMETVGPVSVVIGQGGVFDYFDELRRVIGLANTDILFVDPYMDADFVTSYLPHVSAGVRVRLLSNKYVSALWSAAEMFAKQHNTQVEVRSALGLHDRFVIVDGNACYQSGASFKDGARNASTTLTQITDALSPVVRTYEDLWANGTPAQ